MVEAQLTINQNLNMSTITTILGTDQPKDSRAVINTNFSNLNTDKAELDSPTFTGKVETPAIKITTGAGAGKVLQSDADGDATWEDILTTGFSTTNVFNGAFNNAAYTDLDLSSVIGVNQKVVLLKIYDTSAGVTLAFRTKGDTGDYSIASESSNIGLSELAVSSTSNICYTTIVKTDTSGIIEIKASAPCNGKIDVLAYW